MSTKKGTINKDYSHGISHERCLMKNHHTATPITMKKMITNREMHMGNTENKQKHISETAFRIALNVRQLHPSVKLPMSGGEVGLGVGRADGILVGDGSFF